MVGICEYSAAGHLEFSVADAQEIADALTLPEYDFVVKTLFDGQATRTALLGALRELFESDADNLLFFFSGHGAAAAYGAYLCAADAGQNDLGLDLHLLARLIKANARPGRTTTIVLDCCHAGTMTFGTADGATPLLGPPEVKDSFPSLPEGHVLFAACGPHEEAHECARLGHGIFSFHFIEGLLGSAANAAGQITASSLHDYLCRSLEGSTIAQTIVYRGEITGRFLLGQDFAPVQHRSVDSTQIDQITQQARDHLDLFQDETGRDYAQRELWSQSAYKAACQRLRPIFSWFDKRINEYPELKHHRPFQELLTALRGWQARLGDIENVSETPWGTVEQCLGYGTFGTVWLLKEEQANGEVTKKAFKIYHGQDIRLHDKASRFRRGFEAMKMLDHPRVVKVGELSDCPLGFSMEYIDGPNFRDFTGTLDEPAEQLRLLLTVAETISHAHSRGVIHRDIKPENILLRENHGRWFAHLADFDLAWFSTASLLTKEAIGSAFYSAPEQIHRPRSPAARDPRVDQYAFGQLLFFGLTGADPVQNVNDNANELRGRLRRWPSVDAGGAAVKVYERATAAKQPQRYSSVREICDELHRIILLAETGPTIQISRERLIRELVFGLVGMSDDSEDVSGAFRSLSDRTLVSVEVVRESLNSVSLRFRLERFGTLTMEGLDHEAARRKLSTRIDEVLRDFSGASREPGHQGTYEIFIKVMDIPMTMLGVERGRKMLARVIEAIERA